MWYLKKIIRWLLEIAWEIHFNGNEKKLLTHRRHYIYNNLDKNQQKIMVHDIIFSSEKPSITTSLIYLYLIFKISTLRLEMKQNSTLP